MFSLDRVSTVRERKSISINPMGSGPRLQHHNSQLLFKPDFLCVPVEGAKWNMFKLCVCLQTESCAVQVTKF